MDMNFLNCCDSKDNNDTDFEKNIEEQFKDEFSPDDESGFYDSELILDDTEFNEKKCKELNMAPIFQTNCFKYAYIPCEKSTLTSLLNAQTHGIKDCLESKAWFLGYGLYVCESYTYAYALSKSRSYKEAVVLGLALDLRKCLDLLEYSNVKFLQHEYSILKQKPKLKSGQSKQVIDYEVIEHIAREKHYDSVRGILNFGSELYVNSSMKDCMQILINLRSQNCILSYFNPAK